VVVNLLQRIFSLGRTKAAPLDRTDVVPPASVQRTQLGLREVDLVTGVVTLKDGEVRALVAVSGVPVHHSSQEGARAFLQRWAHAINAFPASTACFMRSRAGVVESYLRGQRDQTAALAQREPGSALARLSADQLAHVRRMAEAGDFRVTENYVGVRNHGGDRAQLLRDVQAVEGHLRAAGLQAELVTDRLLAEALAAAWNPYIAEMWFPTGTSAWRLRTHGHTAHLEHEPHPELAPEIPAPTALPSASASKQVAAPRKRRLPASVKELPR
jgi:hypothetical protein